MSKPHKLVSGFLLLSLLLCLQFMSPEALAQHKGITFQGILKRPDGTLAAATATTANLKVLSPAGCVLRDEDFSGVTLNNGYINLVIGKGTVNGSDPGKTIQAIMNNTTAITGLNCLDSNNNVLSAGQTYTPTSIDARKLRLSMTLDGNPVIMDFNMRAMPFAVNSETLNGKLDTAFVNTNTPQGVTQTNLESVFARFTKLDAILNNFDGTGAVLTGNSTNVTGTVAIANGGTGATTAAAARTNLGLGPLATMVPTGTADNTTYLRGDGTWAAGSGGAVTSVAGRTGVVTLTSADLTDFNAASDTRADGRITAQKGVASGLASLDGSGKVPSTQLALVAADIPNLDAAKITSGTITQNVSATSVAGTTGTFTNLRVYDGTANFLTQTAPAAGFTANYTVQWPAAIGTSGQALQISSVAGAVATLGWVSPTANTVTGTGTANYLPMFTAASTLADSPIVASGGNIGIGISPSVGKLHIQDSNASAVQVYTRNTNAGAGAVASYALANDGGKMGFLSVFSSGYGTIHQRDRVALSAENGSPGLDLMAPEAAGTVRILTGGYAAANERVRIDQNGNVGIGTTAPGAPLEVVSAPTSTAATTYAQKTTLNYSPASASAQDSYGLSVGANYTGGFLVNSTGSIIAVDGKAENASTGSIGSLIGGNFQAKNGPGQDVTTMYGTKSYTTGAATVGTSYGVYSEVNRTANTLANAYGVYGLVGTSGAGTPTINTAYALYGAVSKPTGTITIGYGLYTGTIAATNKWSVYASDATAPSYFAGSVGVGTNAPNTALDLNGALSFRGIAAPAVSVAGQGRIYFDSTSNTFKVSQHNGAYVDLVGAGGGVTSVGLALPAEITVSNSPVITTGSLTGAWANQTTNKVFASPNGSTGTPTFRALVNADLPVIDIAHGGTGLAIGTSGGIPFFDSTTTMASSAALTANGVLLGGGAGASPTSTAAGAAYQPLRIPAGGGAPAFGAIDLSQAAAVTGALPVANGGTATTSYGNNKVIVSNGTGSALVAASCALNQVISFDAGGALTCSDVSALLSAYQAGSIVTLGTVTTGVWNGTIIPVAYGGTGTATGSITGTGALTFTAGGANNDVTVTPTGTGKTVVSSAVIQIVGNSGALTSGVTSCAGLTGAITRDSNGDLYICK